MITWRLPWAGILLLLTLVGCTAFPFQPGSQLPVATSTLETFLTPATLATPAADQTETPNIPEEMPAGTPPAGGVMVRIWLSPEFDPDGNDPASQLLKNRLEQFEAENPDARLEVRIKDLEGTGGLLESLFAANAAAPLALPDVVLLPRALLESATLKGLLYPYDGLTNLMNDPGWFEYARELAHLETRTYGIPFAGDALVMAYHPSMLETAPTDLETTLSLGEEILFQATDPQALYTMCMYLAVNERLQDAEGRPSLNETTLTDIFDFYQRASLAGVMPYWLTQYSNDDQLWEAFMGEPFPMAITWASAYLKHNKIASDLGLAPLPTLEIEPFTLATGWSWTLAGQDSQRRGLSIRLVEYLVEEEFLAGWTLAAGYMPPREGALQDWPDAALQQAVGQISYSAHLMPPADLISSLGPALQQAVVDVLKTQSDPQAAAQAVIAQVSQP